MAAYLYESLVEPDAFPGNATFVAGFTQGMFPYARGMIHMTSHTIR